MTVVVVIKKINIINIGQVSMYIMVMTTSKITLAIIIMIFILVVIIILFIMKEEIFYQLMSLIFCVTK